MPPKSPSNEDLDLTLTEFGSSFGSAASAFGDSLKLDEFRRSEETRAEGQSSSSADASPLPPPPESPSKSKPDMSIATGSPPKKSADVEEKDPKQDAPTSGPTPKKSADVEQTDPQQDAPAEPPATPVPGPRRRSVQKGLSIDVGKKLEKKSTTSLEESKAPSDPPNPKPTEAKEERVAAEQKAEEERLAAVKKDDEEAAKKKADEEAAKKKADEEAAKKKADEEAAKKMAAKKKADEEAATKKAEEEKKTQSKGTPPEPELVKESKSKSPLQKDQQSQPQSSGESQPQQTTKFQTVQKPAPEAQHQQGQPPPEQSLPKKQPPLQPPPEKTFAPLNVPDSPDAPIVDSGNAAPVTPSKQDWTGPSPVNPPLPAPSWTGPSPLPSFANSALGSASPAQDPSAPGGQLSGLLESLRDQMGAAFRPPAPGFFPQYQSPPTMYGWQPPPPYQYTQQDARASGAGPASGVDSAQETAPEGTPAQTAEGGRRSFNKSPSKTWAGLDFTELQKDFRQKLEGSRTRLVPELQRHKEELLCGLQAAEAKAEQVRQIVAEAEREGRQDFESLREHLRSVESLKLAVVGQDKQRQSQTIKGIDALLEKIKRAGSIGFSGDGMAKFVHDFPGMQADADTLLSKPAAPQMDVGLEDIPFEARARKDKLKKFAIMALLHREKDRCLWQVEQQRRALEEQNRESLRWQAHLESLLDRYASQFAQTCYFCAAPFQASTANSPCNYNLGVSARTGRMLPPDSQVPSHIWGAGVHYWVPSTTRAVNVSIQATTPPPPLEPWRVTAMNERMPPTAMPPPPHPLPPPRSVVQVPSSPVGYSLDAFATSVLRRIAILCEQRQMDIRSAFRAFDANGDGFVSAQEFRHAMSRLELGLVDQEIDYLLRMLDVNGDGMLSYEEFLTQVYHSVGDPRIANVGENVFKYFADQDPPAQEMWQRVARAIRERGIPLREAFALFDADGDGVVSTSELKDAFKAMRLGLSDHDIARLMRAIDENEDGRISIHEFVNRLHPPSF